MKRKLSIFNKTKNTKRTKHKSGAQKKTWVLYKFGMPFNKRQERFTLIRTTFVIFELLI
jgi:hypothetical protein